MNSGSHEELWTNTRVRDAFLSFFNNRGHKIFPSSSLTKSGDPSVLLTTAGMQQFKSYYLDATKADSELGTRNAASSQKCFRTTDIDEVGDETHNTFFEMLGNFSFGGYFKKEAIAYAHEFITKALGLRISYVTIFEGLGSVPKDDESRHIWQSLGIEDIREEGIQDVFWGPTGERGPCGPTTEIYCKNSKGKDVEIWNIVFNEYICDISRDALLENPQGAKLKELAVKGIDTGMGFERVLMIAQHTPTIFDTDLFIPLLDVIDGYYAGGLEEHSFMKGKRIIADHMRGAAFLMAEGLEPSNVKAGYILRRILRRAIRYAYQLKLPYEVFGETIKKVGGIYREAYPELSEKRQEIMCIFEKEYGIFGKAVKRGIERFDVIVSEKAHDKMLLGKEIFYLYATFGFPLELLEEMARERGYAIDKKGFTQAFEAHRALSKPH